MSIWDTVEVYCWCRDFKYDEYKRVHTQQETKGAMVSQEMYADLCAAFEAEMELG